MKSCKLAILLFASLFSSLAQAQFTSVTATITDLDGQTWNNGSFTATLINPQPQVPPTLNGTALTSAQMNVSGSIGATGIITTSLASNAIVVPAGTYWQFTICPRASFQCVVQNATTSGSTQNLSTTLSSSLGKIRFPASPVSFGYTDNEVSPTPNPGGSYYNVTSNIMRTWNGSAWTSTTGSSFITSYSTVGSSGPASVVNGNLNIPNYAGGGCASNNCVTSINSSTGAFSFTGNAVVCSTVTCVFNTGAGIPISSLGCPQDGSFQSRTGTDGASCISTALAAATPTNRVVLIQDQNKVTAISGINGPALGNWEIDGNGGGWYSVAITNCTISGNVATFTTKVHTLTVGKVVTVGGFTACTALNNQRLTVASVPDSTHFTASFTASNVASTAEVGTAAYLTGSGFVMLPSAVGNQHMIYQTGQGCTTPILTSQEHGSNVAIKNIVLDGSSEIIYASSQFCMNMAFNNLNNVDVENVTSYAPHTFNVEISGSNGVKVVHNNFIDAFPGIALIGHFNKDGIHLSGNVSNAILTNNYFHVNDDAISLAANEQICGPISNVRIADSVVENSNSMYRMDSISQACASGDIPSVTDVHLVNFSGSVYNLTAWIGEVGTAFGASTLIDNFSWSDSSVTSPEGIHLLENMGDISFENFKWIMGNGSNVSQGAFFIVDNNAIGARSIRFNNVTEYITVAGKPSSPILGFSKTGLGVGTMNVSDLSITGLRVICETTTPANCNLPMPSYLAGGTSTIGKLYTDSVDLSNITLFSTVIPSTWTTNVYRNILMTGIATPWLMTPFDGSINFNNGFADGPLVRGYSANNTNVGFNFSTSYSLNQCTGIAFRFGKQYGETGGAVLGVWDTTGNFCTTGNVAAQNGNSTVFRCVTAGALPVGALTTNSANCGSTADTGFRSN